MARIKVKQFIKNSNENSQKDLYIIKNNNTFIFNDNGTKTKLVINDKKANIVRENKESCIELFFDLNNIQKCYCRLKGTNVILELDVHTKKINLVDKKIEIIYELYSSDEYVDEFIYKLEWSD